MFEMTLRKLLYLDTPVIPAIIAATASLMRTLAALLWKRPL